MGSIGKLSGAVAAIGAPVGLVASLSSVVRIGSAFEKQMSDVQAFVAGAAGSMSELTAKAEELGRETAFTNADAAQAMVELGKANMDASTVLSSIDGVLTLAAAGGVDMAESAKIAAAALNQFRIPAEDMGRVVDVLAKGASSGAITLSELGNQFTFAAAGAADAGMGIEDVAATLASLATVVGADKAGTTLAGITAKMAKPSAMAADELERLKLSFTTDQGKFKSLPQIIDEFNLALGNLSEGDKAKTLNTIFEMRSARGFSQLMRQGGDALRDITKAVQDSDGFGLKVAEQRLDNVAGAFEQVKSASAGLATDFYQIFGEDLKASLLWVRDFIQDDLTNVMLDFKSLLHGIADLIANLIERPAKVFEQLENNFRRLMEGTKDFSKLERPKETIQHVTEKIEPAAKELERQAQITVEDFGLTGDNPRLKNLPNKDENSKGSPINRSPLRLALRGSSEAFEMINKAIKGVREDHLKNVSKQADKQTQIAQNQVSLLETIADGMGDVEVVSLT